METWKPRLLLFVLAVVAAGVLFFFGSIVLKPAVSETVEDVPAVASGAKIEQPLVTFVDPVRGNPDAAKTVIEYGDHACAFCREAENDILRLLATRNDVKFVWKDLPLPSHPGADLAAEAGQCAKSQGKFWEFHQELFAQGGGFNESSLALLAGGGLLDVQAFTRCLTSREMRPLVERSVAEARALGVDGVPFFFINGKRYSGQLTYEDFQEALAR